jgi:hypothetical protein
MSTSFRGNAANGLNRSRSFSNESQRDRLSRTASSSGLNGNSTNNTNNFNGGKSLRGSAANGGFARGKSSSFDEENPFPAPEAFPDANEDGFGGKEAEDDARSPPLLFVPPPYTKYDYFLLTIAIAAPILILVFGELNRGQAWALMNRCYVRDIDNQVRAYIGK